MTDNLLDNDIPEKFKDPDTGDVRLAALLQSYKELERKLSQSPSAPKTFEEYKIDCSHGMFHADVDLNRHLHERGFSQEQAQTVYDLAAERLVPMMAEMAADMQADREVEKLVLHFGGPEKWKEVSRQLLAYGQKTLPEDVLDTLASSYDGVLALYDMMKGKEPEMNIKDGGPQSLGEADLQSLMRDPKYWRDKDPAMVAKVTEGFRTLYGS